MPPEPAPSLRTEGVEHCPVCGGSGPIEHDGMIDTAFGSPGRWRMRRCDGCASLWLDPRPIDDDLALAYERYYTHGEGDAAGAPGGERAKAVLRHLPGHRDDQRASIAYLDGIRPGRVLDVGCGDGRTLVALQLAGWECVGLDPDPSSIEAARAAGALDVRLGTIDTIDEPPGSFDAVVSIHSLEHVPDPRAVLDDARSLLEPGGVISVVTPNARSWLHERHGGRWRGLEPPRHLQVFSPEGLDRLLVAAGFGSVTITTSARGANGIARAYRAAGTTTRGRWRSLAGYAAGELWQLAEVVRLRRHRLVGEELVATARLRPPRSAASAR